VTTVVVDEVDGSTGEFRVVVRWTVVVAEEGGGAVTTLSVVHAAKGMAKAIKVRSRFMVLCILFVLMVEGLPSPLLLKSGPFSPLARPPTRGDKATERTRQCHVDKRVAQLRAVAPRRRDR
jgi:hypothetical protein